MRLTLLACLVAGCSLPGFSPAPAPADPAPVAAPPPTPAAPPAPTEPTNPEPPSSAPAVAPAPGPSSPGAAPTPSAAAPPAPTSAPAPAVTPTSATPTSAPVGAPPTPSTAVAPVVPAVAPVVPAVAVVTPAPATAPADTTAADIEAARKAVEAIYTAYAGAGDPPELTRFASGALKSRIRAAEAYEEANDTLLFEFDPVVNAEEALVSDVVTTGSLVSGKMKVEVKFKNLGASQKLTYTLVKEGESWKVNNISSSKWDLWKLLTVPAAAP